MLITGEEIMKKNLLIMTLFLLGGIVSFAQAEPMDSSYSRGKPVNDFPFYVYKDGNYSQNNFSPSGYMGDFKDLKIDFYHRQKPFSGNSCIKIVYKHGESTKNGWAGLYWLDPADNWGDNPGGYDLKDADKLTFWARGEKGGEEISLFQIGGIISEYRDIGIRSIGPITLSRNWQQYTISREGLSPKIIVTKGDPNWVKEMEPLSRIIGGFCWVANMYGDQDIIFYLDEIKYEQMK
jgi:hypothetical protein